MQWSPVDSITNVKVYAHAASDNDIYFWKVNHLGIHVD